MTTHDELLARLPEQPATRPDQPSKDTLDRRQQIWARQPDLHYDQVIIQADTELAAERAQQEQVNARAQALTDSFQRMTACRTGCGAQTNGSDGYCLDCHEAAVVKRGLAKLNDRIGGHSREELIQADLDHRRAAADQKAS
jgi:hypothetical protein